MKMFGLVLQPPIHLLPQLMPTRYTLILPTSIPPKARSIVTTVSPSAVWYTNSQTCQLYFVRSGHLNIHRGDLAAVGSNGYNRSSIAGGTNWGQLLGFAEDVVVPSDGSHDRQYGLPVRCLVYKLEKRKTLYFVRSGWVNLNNSALRSFGIYGYDWSRSSIAYSSATSAKAYYLDFHASGVYPSSNDNRWLAFPVRCLV